MRGDCCVRPLHDSSWLADSFVDRSGSWDNPLEPYYLQLLRCSCKDCQPQVPFSTCRPAALMQTWRTREWRLQHPSTHRPGRGRRPEPDEKLRSFLRQQGITQPLLELAADRSLWRALEWPWLCYLGLGDVPNKAFTEATRSTPDGDLFDLVGGFRSYHHHTALDIHELQDGRVHLYSDGSFLDDTQQGGWGFAVPLTQAGAVYVGKPSPSHQHWMVMGGPCLASPGGAHVRNIRPEAFAALAAAFWYLDECPSDLPMVCHVDCHLVLQSVQQWQLSPAIVDITVAIRSILDRAPHAQLTWIRGHAGHLGNILADQEAKRWSSSIFLGDPSEFGTSTFRFDFLPDHRGPLIPNDLHGAPKRRAAGDGTALVLRFHLPRASYATMAVRELMKMGGPAVVERVMAY
eukprot:Skav203021  [mRNA]  locus=scaffold583:336905:338743:+ [translate_table: standard]